MLADFDARHFVAVESIKQAIDEFDQTGETEPTETIVDDPLKMM